MPEPSSDLLLDAQSAPLLHRDAAIRLAETGVVVDTPYWELTVHDHAEPLFKLLASANGITELGDLAADVGLEWELAARLLEALAEEGAVTDARAPLRADPGAFLDTFQLECRLMMRSLSELPFWRKLLNGEASRTLVLGWGIEFAHFVEAANEYMPLGIAYARGEPAVREILSRHYAEEANHAAIFVEGLLRCGLDQERLSIAPPLATTRGLINLLVEHAIEGAATYAAGFAVMQPESEPADRASVRAFYEELSSLYPFARPMLRAFERHACLDLELGHHETVFKSLYDLGAIPSPARPRALEAARAVAEAFTMFFEGILDFYDRPSASIPRRPARL
jgi:pyrroloquinoline quinone (PQQ) biosynthesis protein C